jgi:hypothetical protein
MVASDHHTEWELQMNTIEIRELTFGELEQVAGGDIVTTGTVFGVPGGTLVIGNHTEDGVSLPFARFEPDQVKGKGKGKGPA